MTTCARGFTRFHMPPRPAVVSPPWQNRKQNQKRIKNI
nr:MAG TPA: hypothetical protein [Bacteriophage sp.]